MTAFTDDFNRADSATTLGSPWQVLSGSAPGHPPVWGISTNQAYVVSTYVASSTAYDSIAYIDSDGGEFDISVTMATLGNTNSTGLVFRMDSTGSSYFKFDRQDLYWVSGGTETRDNSGTLSAGGANTWVSGDTVRVTGVGTRLTFYVNGVSIGYVDRTENQTEGRHGLLGNQIFEPSTRFENFSLTAAAAVVGGWVVGAVMFGV